MDTSSRREKTRPSGRRSRTRPITLWHLALAVVVGLVVVAGIGYGLWRVNGRGDVTASLVRTAVLAAAALGAVPAGYVAYRRQRTAEQERLDDQDQDLRDRFAKAAEQLGDDAAAVRMAGVYAMAHVADDWGLRGDRTQRQMCVDVLCAYLRLPYGGDSTPEATAHAEAEREVRRTLVRVIRDHLRTDKTPEEASRWSDLSFSFQGAHLEGPDFTGSHFTGAFVSFRDVTFSGDEVWFDRVVLAADKVSFSGAVFEAELVSFAEAVFERGRIRFQGARHTRGRLSFKGARADAGADLRRRTFTSDGGVDWGDLPAPTDDREDDAEREHIG